MPGPTPEQIGKQQFEAFMSLIGQTPDFGNSEVDGTTFCPGRIEAQNVPAAYGRVHLYDRGSGVEQRVSCNTFGLNSPNAIGHSGNGEYSIFLDPGVTCPVVHVTPWIPGHYDEAEPLVDMPEPLNDLDTPGFLTANIRRINAGVEGAPADCVTTIILQVHLTQTDGSTSLYNVEPAAESPPPVAHDAIFDITVYGCPCNE